MPEATLEEFLPQLKEVDHSMRMISVPLARGGEVKGIMCHDNSDTKGALEKLEQEHPHLVAYTWEDNDDDNLLRKGFHDEDTLSYILLDSRDLQQHMTKVPDIIPLTSQPSGE